MKSWVVSLASVCKAGSSREANGRGFGSNADKFPKSNVKGIALGGFRDLQ
jgi:hypothetical protein